MDPKTFAVHLKAKWATREADERARQRRAEERARAEEEAGRLLQQAIVDRVVPYFRTLTDAGRDFFDCRAITESGKSEVSWIEFQFERGEVFRLGRRGAALLIERREGPPPSGFAAIKPRTTIERAEHLTNDKIGALLEELSELPPPLRLLLRTKTDLDGDPV
jgi:hypothetical protein